GSAPVGLSCAGDPRGRRRPPSPPDLSSLQPGALGPPGSPRPPACLAPGAPFQPAEPSTSAPGSPDVSPELPAPGSPESSPAEVSVTSVQAPGAPSSSSAVKPRLSISCSPGSPHTPGEGSPDTSSPPSIPELPTRVTCPPGSPEAAAEYSSSPSPPPEPSPKASRPPGSPEGPDDSPVSPQSPEGPDFSPHPASRDSGLRRSSEGVLQPPNTGQGMGVLGGSLSALPHDEDLLSDLSLGSEPGWSFSQSFEWRFPSQGARRLASPPRSPIREAADSGLSDEGESDGENASPSPPHSQGDSGSEGSCSAVASSRGTEGAPCPGGPVVQQEAEGSAEEEKEGEAEQDAVVPCSPLCVTEPGHDPADPEPELLTEATPPDLAPPALATEASSAWAPTGNCPVSLQGPGGPGQAEGSLRVLDPHADPGWLTELLASPGAHTARHGSPDAEGTEDLLGWSRKDLCSEFGIGRPHQDGTFDWTHEPMARERDWPGETEQDQEFGTKSSWDSTLSIRDRDRQDAPFSSTGRDWGSNHKRTELMGEARLGRSDWPTSHGTGESCLQDQGFGAGKPEWGSGYGLGSVEEMGSGKADWSHGYGVRHGQQQDKELSSGQPNWAGRYSSGDPENQGRDIAAAWAGEYGTGGMEMKDKELTPDWGTKYSSRDTETKDEDLTLGWAGRSSTGDTVVPDKFSPSSPAWDSKYSSREMESQDREFSPSRPAWTGEYSTQSMESQDREFSPSRLAWGDERSTRDMESQDDGFTPSRPAWDDRYSTRDMESQDREFSADRPTWGDEHTTGDLETRDGEFSPSRSAWASEYSSREMETQDREFSPSRPAWDSDCGSKDMETQDSGFLPSRPAWEDRFSPRDVENQDREFSPSRPAWASEYSSMSTEKEAGEFSPDQLSWAGECSVGQSEPVGGFGVRNDDVPGCCAPDLPAQEPGWGSADQQEHDTTEELGGAECHNQFGITGTEWVPDPSDTGASSDGSMSWASEMRPGGQQEPLGDWHRDLSFSSSGATSGMGTGDAGGVEPGQTVWGQGLGSLPGAAVEEPGWSRDPDATGWTMELCDAEAKRQEWASAFGARCAARSRDFGAGEQSPGGDTDSVDGTIHFSDPSPPMDDAPTDPPAAETPQSEPPSPTEEERDSPEPAATPRSPRASPPLLEAASGTLPGTESKEAPLDHLDGKRPPSWEEKGLCLCTPQPEESLDPTRQEFTFLEDTEVLDSSVYRSKASLGRKRRHRAPALRPGATSEGDSWIFQDSTAGLNASVLKAKLRGRNRSVEEGTLPGDSKATPAKDPHAQRSKSCKI
ncbi:PREDICTED: 182 kDa tankyrase-1-binding protein-like, partial [Mesitornis unicolor]|uniref:182 kDa tankyrase-1-binding protein-like n=1 Tax=Mesitornis unicolor TaxID=54374 RepID=UPI000528A12F